MCSREHWSRQSQFKMPKSARIGFQRSPSSSPGSLSSSPGVSQAHQGSLKLSRGLSSSPGVSQALQGVFYQGILWVQSRERGEEKVVLLKRSSGRRPPAGLAARWSSSSLLQGSPCLVLRKRRGTPAQLREPEPLACPQPQDGAQVTQD